MQLNNIFTGNQYDGTSDKSNLEKAKEEQKLKSLAEEKKNAKIVQEQNSPESNGVLNVQNNYETTAISMQNDNLQQNDDKVKDKDMVEAKTPKDLADWIEPDPDDREKLFKPHPTSEYMNPNQQK